MPTFGLAAQGAVSNVLATPSVVPGGPFTLPAGGPWIIHKIWTNIIHSTVVAAEGISGTLRFDSLAGDITPDPAPGLYPLVGPNPIVGATAPASVMPTQMFDVNWTAAGKAVVELATIIDASTTNAPMAQAGIIFGDAIPERRPVMFSDRVQAVQTNAAETQIGIVQLSERATRIVGLLGYLSKNTALTASQPIMGSFRLDSNDVKMPPAFYPYSNAISPSLGAAVMQPSGHAAQYIPVDIPVQNGSRIFVNSTLIGGVTAGVNCDIYIAYE